MTYAWSALVYSSLLSDSFESCQRTPGFPIWPQLAAALDALDPDEDKNGNTGTY
jgi:hypothetical protein